MIGPDASGVAEHAARTAYGRLVAILSARSRDIAAAEDALSDALVAALRTWPQRGIPDNPQAWLLASARNRLANGARHDLARRRAEPDLLDRVADLQDGSGGLDQRLRLMFVCAHPAIDAATRTPLMLQTVLGLDAARIASAFLVSPTTMGQRLVRAKAKIRDAGLRFELPEKDAFAGRLEAVLEAIYAAFGTGWDEMESASGGQGMTGEALFLARLLVLLLPHEPEPMGLLALMLYTSARRAARRDEDGSFVPLHRQDSRLWDRDSIIEAEGLLTRAARARRYGRYQCEAAIQSVHIQRPLTGRTNYQALAALYDLLVAQGAGQGAQIARAVVVAETGDAARALTILDGLPVDRTRHHQPYHVARARVLEALNRRLDAVASLETAKALTTDQAVIRYLSARQEALLSARSEPHEPASPTDDRA